MEAMDTNLLSITNIDFVIIVVHSPCNIQNAKRQFSQSNAEKLDSSITILLL